MAESTTSIERLQTAVDAAGVGTWDLDVRTGELVWSIRCKEIFGLPPTAEVTYDFFLECVHPDDRAHTQAAVEQAFDPTGSGGYAIDYRTQWNVPGQSPRWAHATGRAFFDANRTQALRFIGTITDITDQKANQEALRQREADLITMADSIAQLAWIAEADGAISWYNRRWCEYTGTTPGTALSAAWEQAQHPDYTHGITERLHHAFATGEVWEETFPLRGRDGLYRWFLASAVPLRDEQGQVLRWFGTCTDVTQMRELQERLTQAYEDLEVKVTFRNLTLEHEVQQLRAQLAHGGPGVGVPPKLA